MGKKILVIAAALTMVGLLFLAYSDPLFRSSTVGPGEFGNFSSFTRSFNGTFPAGFGNSTLFRGAGATSQTSRIEGYLGVALIGVGTLLVVAQLLTTPDRSSRRRQKTRVFVRGDDLSNYQTGSIAALSRLVFEACHTLHVLSPAQSPSSIGLL